MILDCQFVLSTEILRVSHYALSGVHEPLKVAKERRTSTDML